MSTSQPPELDPESGPQVYLQADIRPAIRAATKEQMPGILRQISEHVCHQVGGMQSFPAPGSDRRAPREICQAGVGVLPRRPAATLSPAILGTPAACDQRGIR